MFKKALLLLLAAGMALTLLAACAKDGGNDDTTTQAPATTDNAGETKTDAPAETPDPEPTEAPTPTKEPEQPGMRAKITVGDSPENWAVFGGSEIVEGGDARVPKPVLRLMHDSGPTEDTQYESGGTVKFTVDKACRAQIYIELACPDAVNGASGYYLDYSVNTFDPDTMDFDYIFLDGERESTLDILQEFMIEVDLQEGENTLYMVQRTDANAGGWRIVVTSVTVVPRGDAVVSGYTEAIEPETTVVDVSDGTVLGAHNFDVNKIVGAQAEECTGDEDAPGGKNLAYLDPGAKIYYALNVLDAGTYVLTFKVACLDASTPSGSFDIFVDDKYADSFENDLATGGWQNFEVSTVTAEIKLEAGAHELLFEVTTGGFNVSSITLAKK